MFDWLGALLRQVPYTTRVCSAPPSFATLPRTSTIGCIMQMPIGTTQGCATIDYLYATSADVHAYNAVSSCASVALHVRAQYL